jgi:hypothetical protein
MRMKNLGARLGNASWYPKQLQYVDVLFRRDGELRKIVQPFSYTHEIRSRKLGICDCSGTLKVQVLTYKQQLSLMGRSIGNRSVRSSE